MSQSVSVGRVLSAALLAIVVVGVASGCSWFRKGVKGDYALSPEMRPLEVPPDLNLPDTSSAMALPSAAGSPAGGVPAAHQHPMPPSTSPGSTGVPAAATGGFAVAGDRDEVYTKVGTALAGIDGVTITSSVQLLGSYDVTYQDSSFLVRVSNAEAGSYVSALDPRGLPATDAAPTQLMAALKTALAQ